MSREKDFEIDLAFRLFILMYFYYTSSSNDIGRIIITCVDIAKHYNVSYEIQSGPKVMLSKKIEYIPYGPRKVVDFLLLIEACSSVISIRTRSRTVYVK